MLCIDLEPDEAKWIKNAILDELENNYEGGQAGRDEISYLPMEKFPDISLEDWRIIHTLYQKLSQ